MGLLVALVAAMGVTLATPASIEAGGFRFRRSCYVEPRCSGPVVDCWPTESTVVTPGDYPTYYPTGPSYSPGYYQTDRGYFSGYYRVGNVIINGRRWGDIGNRYSHGDLIRW